MKGLYRISLVDANFMNLGNSDFEAENDKEAISNGRKAFEEHPSAHGLYVYKYEHINTCGPIQVIVIEYRIKEARI